MATYDRTPTEPRKLILPPDAAGIQPGGKAPEDRPAVQVLHPSRALRPGSWYACRSGGRPFHPELVAFDWNCPTCCDIADQINAQHPGMFQVERRTPSGIVLVTRTTVDDELRAARSRTDPRRR